MDQKNLFIRTRFRQCKLLQIECNFNEITNTLLFLDIEISIINTNSFPDNKVSITNTLGILFTDG